jgi:hypothetical protein
MQTCFRFFFHFSASQVASKSKRKSKHASLRFFIKRKPGRKQSKRRTHSFPSFFLFKKLKEISGNIKIHVAYVKQM